jgi:hypothetical protein
MTAARPVAGHSEEGSGKQLLYLVVRDPVRRPVVGSRLAELRADIPQQPERRPHRPRADADASHAEVAESRDRRGARIAEDVQRSVDAIHERLDGVLDAVRRRPNAAPEDIGSAVVDILLRVNAEESCVLEISGLQSYRPPTR